MPTPKQEETKKYSKQYTEVMDVIDVYDKSDLVDLIGLLMEGSPAITNFIHDELLA